MEKVLSLYLLVMLLPVGNAQQCFTVDSCSGSSRIVSSVEECCLGDGISYDDGAGCMTCIVFGWLDGVRGVEDSEQGQAITLEVGYLKGDDARGLNLRYDVMNIPGTAEIGANNDYTMSNTQNLRPRPNQPVSVLLTLRVDNIALEERETLSLRLIPLSAASSVRPGVTEVFLDTLNVTIIDQDTVGIKFTVPCYRAREGDEVIEVVVERETRIARPVTVRIVPLNYSVFEVLLNSGVIMRPDDFPFSADDQSPEPVLRAKSVPEERRDFNITPIEVTFGADEFFSADIGHLIDISEDQINEADEVFVVILELVDTELSAQVDLGERGASLCRIVDNDLIRIGFEQPTYTVAERFVRPFVDLIYIIKEDDRISEQTFELGIHAGAPAQGVASAATRGTIDDISRGLPVDYTVFSITGFVQDPFFPDERRVLFEFTPLPDEIPESREAFQVSVEPTQQSAPFLNGQFPITVVFIEDDDDVIIGFEQTSVTVPEDVGTFELCLSVSAQDLPDGLLPAGFNVLINLDTTAGTAGPGDYRLITQLQFTNEMLQQCFPVTIIEDPWFETLETFTITALPQDPNDPVVIVPSTVTITILDNDLPPLGVLIGVLQDRITAREDADSMIVRVMKEGTLSSQESIRASFTTVDNTARAGQDYSNISTVITLGPEDTEMTVTIPLIDDNVFEGQENFTGVLSLVSPPPNVELVQSEVQLIITDDDVITVQFSQSSYTISEDEGTVVLMIQKVGSNAIPIEVSLISISGSATRGMDFTSLNETLVIPPGDSQLLAVSAVIIEDEVAEGTEFFEVTIVSSDQVTVGTIQRARVEITDNDVALGFTQASLRVLESDGAASVTVQRQAEVERSITVRLFTQDDEATAPTDYTAVQRLITIESSTESTTIPITIVNDDFIEADERFFVQLELVSPQSGVVISRRRTRIIIETDDECPGAGTTVSEKPLMTTDPLAIRCVNICFPAFGQKEICPS